MRILGSLSGRWTVFKMSVYLQTGGYSRMSSARHYVHVYKTTYILITVLNFRILVKYYNSYLVSFNSHAHDNFIWRLLIICINISLFILRYFGPQIFLLSSDEDKFYPKTKKKSVILVNRN